MKKNTKLLIIVGVLLLVVVSASFAYYIARTKITGEGSNIGGTTERMIEVEYDAKNGKLATDNMYPGVTASKDFTVTVTPGSVTNEATYVIKLNITENTFEYCTDENYNEITNACKKGEPELIYTLKDSNGNIISTDDITGKTGTIELARETKVVTERTVYTYTLEITNVETNADQNHNANKVVTGEVVVEFGEKVQTVKDIIANSKKGEGTPNFSKTSCASGCGETTVGIYEGNDDDGISYYYRGDVDDNYVKFANKYWRIIRINGDGTVRLIYQGTSATSTGTDAQIGTSAFNSSNNDNMYVGFKYTSGQVHGTGTDSTILGQLNTWYTNNLASYSSKLDMNTGFCGDRTPYTNELGTAFGGGTGTITTYYGAYIRLDINKSASLTCLTEDFYTTVGTSKGNKSLTYPIGLITVDEAAMAGGLIGTVNQQYYLYTGQTYWTLSPSSYSGGAVMFCVHSSGYLGASSVGSVYGIRPVINLRADTLFYEDGNGTMDNPYIVID